jgi:hypothetical protein
MANKLTEKQKSAPGNGNHNETEVGTGFNRKRIKDVTILFQYEGIYSYTR